MAESPPPPASPRWGPLTKFLAGLVLVTLAGWLLARFQQLIPPLGLAFILAYLLNPAVEWLATRTRLKWGLAVTLVYVALVLLLVAALTVAGIAIGQQIKGLYDTVVEILPNLPARLQDLLSQPVRFGPFTLDFSRPIAIGPFVLDFSTFDLQPLYDQLLSAIQPALRQTGALVGSLASGTANALGWFLFTLIISYYVLIDSKNILPAIERIVPDEYDNDVRRLARELGPIWNAFLRGQVTLALVMGLVVGVTLAALGVRYALVLGLLAGALEFIPIFGPFIAGAVAVLVALFQPDNWMNLPPVYFALLILGVQILLQQLENNFLVPRIIGGSLNLHPVVVLVGALVGASLAGLTGLMLSAPVIATLRLFGRYVYCKMLDLDPWPEPPPAPPSPPREPRAVLRRLRELLRRLFAALPGGRRSEKATAPGKPDAPRVDFSYTVYWTKHVPEWDAARRAAVREALQQVLSQPGFEPNAYERRYTVPGLDDLAHSGASLVALKKVLAAFENE
jgi:predicted PurR-regulated permease PerM